jgi:hypothetical protein
MNEWLVTDVKETNHPTYKEHIAKCEVLSSIPGTAKKKYELALILLTFN